MNHLLKTVPIFAGLDNSAVKLFVDHAVESAYPPGGVIAREGESNHSMYLIGQGSVRIVKYFGQPHEAELSVLKAPDFFGEMCILEPAPRAATAQAIESSIVFQIQASAFYHLYKEMPSQYGILILNISRDLSRRLRHLDEVFAARHK